MSIIVFEVKIVTEHTIATIIPIMCALMH